MTISLSPNYFIKNKSEYILGFVNHSRMFMGIFIPRMFFHIPVRAKDIKKAGS
jgi:hypothetical protein